MSKASSLNPFQVVTVVCPVCENEGQHWKIKSTLFVEKNRDIDLRPRRIVWNNKVSPKVDPKLYYFWHCKSCNFCADYHFYQAPFKDGNMSPTRFRKHLQKSLDRDSIYPQVLAVLDPGSKNENSDFMTGLRRNLLAIYQLESVEEVRERECLQIASYYLRLAWMVRDIKSSKAKADKFKAPTRALLTKIRKVWKKVALTERDMLQKAVHYYETGLQKSQAVGTTPKEIQIILIIARIYFQQAELESGQRTLLLAKKKSTQFSSIALKKEKEGRLDQKQLDHMSTSASKSASLVKNVETIFETLRDAKLDREVKAAKEHLKGHETKDVEIKRDMLREKGIPEKIILIACPPVKKKGLLEFLKSG